MGYSIISKNSAQKIVGSTISSGEVVILAAAPLTAYTCPTGKTEKVHVVAQVRALTATQNVRFRVAGGIVYQVGASATDVSPPVKNLDLGIFVLNSAQTVSCTTQNAGTEGGSVVMTVSVLESVPA